MPFFHEIMCNKGWGGVWKTTESFEELCNLLPAGEIHRSYAEQHFTSDKRRLEYIAVRVLVYTLIGEDKKIAYHTSGKPYFADGSINLSISHTTGYVAVIFSCEAEVGVDIEAYSERVLRLKERIVGQEERATSVYEILLHWSAKETAFKIINREGIDFCSDFTVSALDCRANKERPDTEGTFFLKYHRETSASEIFLIHYKTSENYVLTFSCHSKSIR